MSIVVLASILLCLQKMGANLREELIAAGEQGIDGVYLSSAQLIGSSKGGGRP